MKLTSVEICHGQRDSASLGNNLAGFFGEIPSTALGSKNQSDLVPVRVPVLLANSLYSGPGWLRTSTPLDPEVFQQTSVKMSHKLLRPAPDRKPVSLYDRVTYTKEEQLEGLDKTESHYLVVRTLAGTRRLLASLRKAHGYCATVATQLPKSGNCLFVEARLYPGRTVLQNYFSGTGSLALQLIFRPLLQPRTPDVSIYTEPLDQMMTLLFAHKEEAVCYIDGTTINREQLVDWPNKLTKTLERFAR